MAWHVNQSDGHCWLNQRESGDPIETPPQVIQDLVEAQRRSDPVIRAWVTWADNRRYDPSEEESPTMRWDRERYEERLKEFNEGLEPYSLTETHT